MFWDFALTINIVHTNEIQLPKLIVNIWLKYKNSKVVAGFKFVANDICIILILLRYL